MFSVIIEAIASVLAESLSTKALGKGQQRHPKLFGWIGLFVLVALTVGCVLLGLYLLTVGTWPIAIILFAVAGLLLYVTALPIFRRVKAAKRTPDV